VTEIIQPPPALEPRPAPQREGVAPDCPYVGLVPFDESDAPYFFGRQRDGEVVVANLTTARLTLLYAGSGVGKSSVLRAGVLPRLREIARESYEDLDVPDAAVAYVREWCADPLVSIATEILGAVAQVPGTSPVEMPGSPTLGVPWLCEVIQRSGVAAIYLILDQFEEYFRYHPDDLGDEGLEGQLGRILSIRDLPVNVLLSIREDELAALDRFKGRIPRLYDNYLRLSHLARECAREAITGPLERYNQVVPPGSAMMLDPDLIDPLLDQVRTGHLVMSSEGPAARAAVQGRQSIEAPFLQLVLTRLWEHERASGSSVLRRSTLDELGGAQQIVQNHLHSVMEQLSPEYREVAAKVFQYLVTPTGAKSAQAADTLAEWSGVPLESVQTLLRSLSAGRQSVLRPVPSPQGMGGSSLYEIFHDVMGPAVLEWRRSYAAQQQQADASRRLAAERQKVEEARVAAQRARRQLHQSWIIMTLVIIVALVVSCVAYQSYLNDKQQNALARAATVLSHGPAQSLEYAVDAYETNARKIVPWVREADNQARSAVLIAASSPRSVVVAGPKPVVIGMKSTPDSRHVVAYDAGGNIWIISDNGTVREAKPAGLRGAISPMSRVAAVSPDASRIALGTDQGAVTVINTTTGQHVDIDGEGKLPRAVEWIGPAANGLVLVISSSEVATTHNAETGQQLARIPDVYDAVPLADQQHIVTAGKDNKLRVWDAYTGAKIAESATLDPAANELERYRQSVVSLSVVGLSVGAKPSLVVWNWQAGPNPVRHPIDDADDVQQVMINERTQTAIIGHDKKVQTYSLVDGSPLGSLPQQADFITDVASSPDGEWITTADANGRVLVWSLRNLQSPTAPTYQLLAHSGQVTRVSYLGDGQTVVSLGADGTVRRWDLPHVPRFAQHHNWVVNTSLSGDGSLLVTAGQDGTAFIVDPRDLSKPPVARVAVGAPLRAVLFDPTDPHRIVTLGRSVRVPVQWSWRAGENTKQGQAFQVPSLPTLGSLVSFAISPDGKLVAAGDDHGTVYLWDTATGRLHPNSRFLGTGQPAHSIAFSPNGQLLAATDAEGVRLWQLGTKQPPDRLKHPHVRSVTFDATGRHIASTAGDGEVELWPSDGKSHSEPDGLLVAHDRMSSSPSFSRDGTHLAVGTATGLVEVWDVQSGVTVMLDRHHSGAVNSVAFLPGDASRLVSASDDTTVAQFGCPACTDPDRVIQDAVRSVDMSRKQSG